MKNPVMLLLFATSLVAQTIESKNVNNVKIRDGAGADRRATVPAVNTPPTLADSAVITVLSPTNTGLPVNFPVIIQQTADKSSGSVSSLAKAYASNTVKGNSLVVSCAVGNGTAPTITDTQTNTWNQAVFQANSTTFAVGWFYAVNTVGGADTVTCTNNGAAASMAIAIYEISGLIQRVPDVLDQTNSTTGTGTSLTTNSATPVGVNELAFAAFSVGTAAQTITVAGGFTNDSGQQNPTTPAGLFSFVSASRYVSTLISITAPASIASSEPWAAALAIFKPVLLGVSGQANVRGDSLAAISDPGTAPVKIGGVYKSTQDTYADSNRTQFASSVRGAMLVATGVENVSTNIAQVAGGTVTTVASGTQKVGTADSIGTAFLSAANGLNSTGGGNQSVQIVGQFDDTGPQTVTENQFGNLRMSSKGVLYGQIRDAAGNERGVNVDSTNRLSVSVDNSNVSTNIAQINGVTPLMGNGATGTGSARITVANDSTPIAGWGHATVGSAPPTGVTMTGGIGSGATGGLVIQVTRCDQFANIQQTAGAQIITGVASRRIYVCSLNLVTATAQNIAVVAGTGTVCATNTVAVPGTSGGTTAATGWNFAANSGIVIGSGLGAIAQTTVNADNLCILQSGSGQLSGGISYAIY